MFFNNSSKSTSFFVKFNFAFSIISSDNPSFLLISNALLFPGTPINKWYVGESVFISNSTDAFSNPFVINAYFFIFC